MWIKNRCSSLQIVLTSHLILYTELKTYCIKISSFLVTNHAFLNLSLLYQFRCKWQEIKLICNINWRSVRNIKLIWIDKKNTKTSVHNRIAIGIRYAPLLLRNIHYDFFFSCSGILSIPLQHNNIILGKYLHAGIWELFICYHLIIKQCHYD